LQETEAVDQKFGKAYKLCSKKAIESLFKNKKTVKQHPFVVNYAVMDLPTTKTFQVVISAPKRLFRKAHDRNRIKRLMREVIRKKKVILEEHLSDKGQQLALFLIYTVQDELRYELLEQKMEQILNKLVNDLKREKHDQTN
jgi:ribonuclease P protein component